MFHFSHWKLDLNFFFNIGIGKLGGGGCLGRLAMITSISLFFFIYPLYLSNHPLMLLRRNFRKFSEIFFFFSKMEKSKSCNYFSKIKLSGFITKTMHFIKISVEYFSIALISIINFWLWLKRHGFFSPKIYQRIPVFTWLTWWGLSSSILRSLPNTPNWPENSL